MKLYFMCHGETTWDVQNKMQGQTDESRLTPRGKAQAYASAKKLPPVIFNQFWSSDLDRANATAQIISSVFNRDFPSTTLPKLQISSLLRGRHFGVFQGQAKPVPGMKTILHGAKPKGGEGIVEVRARIESFFKGLKGENILCISHEEIVSETLRMVFCDPPVMGSTMSQGEKVSLRLPPASLSVFELNSGSLRLITWNA